jgi:hypothetical protein
MVDVNRNESTQREAGEAICLEITKLLLSNSFEYLRGAGQTVQALTALLLTAYVSILGIMLREVDLQRMSLSYWIVAFLPSMLFIISLIVTLVSILLYRGSNITVNNVESIVNQYEVALQTRRKQVMISSILTLVGIIALCVNLFNVSRLETLYSSAVTPTPSSPGAPGGPLYGPPPPFAPKQ